MSANPIYNIHLLSKKGTQVNGTDNQVSFFFDWNMMPKGKYKCSFTFIGSKNILVGNNVCLVSCRLGASKNFEAGGDNVATSSSNILGHLFPSSLSTSPTLVNFLYSKLNCNSVTYLDSLPVTNEIVIELIDAKIPSSPFLDDNANDGAQPVGSDYGWILSLSLEHLG